MVSYLQNIKNYCKIHLVQFVVIIGLFIFALISCFMLINKNVSAKEEVIKEEKKKKEQKVENLKVDVKGAVNNPGVYELPKGSRVIDAINIAGGLKEEANTEIINLSKILQDEFVIVVYTNNDLKQVVMDKYVENNYSCPSTINDACIVDSNVVANNKSTNTTTSTTSTNKTTNSSTSSIVNLNTATLEQLQSLTGIGQSKAEAIIQYREENGGFKSVDELTNVSGIGQSTLEKIKSNITV